MKRIALIAGIATLAVSEQASAQTPTVWHGVAIMTAANAACNNVGWAVGNRFTFVIRPRLNAKNDLVNNGPSSLLSLYRDNLGVGFMFTNRDIRGAGPFNVTGNSLYSRGGWGSYTTQATNVSTIPTNVQSTTDSVSFEATFSNFNNNTGCVATFRGSGTRRP